jgi:single-strand DNA-binding protein
MSYLKSVTLVGFFGADPEQRQARNNGAKFTVLSVATQRSWKNADDEWSSKTEWHRISIFRPRLAEHVLTAIKKGAHVLIEGSLVSSIYEVANGKGKKTKGTKVTSWSIRADVAFDSVVLVSRPLFRTLGTRSSVMLRMQAPNVLRTTEPNEMPVDARNLK